MEIAKYLTLLAAVITLSGCRQARELAYSYSIEDYWKLAEANPEHIPVMFPAATRRQANQSTFREEYWEAYRDWSGSEKEGAVGIPIGSEGFGIWAPSFPIERARWSSRRKNKEGFTPVRANVRFHDYRLPMLRSWTDAFSDSLLIPCWVHDVKVSFLFDTWAIGFSFGPHRGFITREDLEASLTKSEIELLKTVIGEEALTNGWNNSEVHFIAFPHSVLVPRAKND